MENSLSQLPKPNHSPPCKSRNPSPSKPRTRTPRYAQPCSPNNSIASLTQAANLGRALRTCCPQLPKKAAKAKTTEKFGLTLGHFVGMLVRLGLVWEFGAPGLLWVGCLPGLSPWFLLPEPTVDNLSWLCLHITRCAVAA